MDARRIAAATILEWISLLLYGFAVWLDTAADIFDRNVPVIGEDNR